VSFSNKNKLRLIVLIIVLSFIPFNTEMVPEWKLQVLDNNGEILPGVQVEESWDNYSFFFEGFEWRRADQNGYVVFPARHVWAGLLGRILLPAFAKFGELSHGSSGLSIGARVFDPEAKYYSTSDDMISWYSGWDKDRALPNTIIGTKNNDE
jgi:hypothetical protein